MALVTVALPEQSEIVSGTLLVWLGQFVITSYVILYLHGAFRVIVKVDE